MAAQCAAGNEAQAKHHKTLLKESSVTKTLLKSSPTNRLEAIVEGLIHASNMALKHADMPLSRMPEYFMAVHVAQHIAKSFANFGYRLEASVKQTLSDAGVDESEIDDLLKSMICAATADLIWCFEPIKEACRHT